MDWAAQVDNYCERMGSAFWAEPINAVTNAAFILGALYVWAQLGGKRDLGARVLTGILALIGIGSFLFHTYATRIAALADVVPILLFILVYVYLATRRFFAQPLWAGVLAVALFMPYSAAVAGAVSAAVGDLNGSVSYVPVPILILVYAALVLRRDVVTARGLAIGAGILVVSLFFRTVDAAVCPGLPIGTHFLWHLLNGVMLSWMILVLHRHEVHRF